MLWDEFSKILNSNTPTIIMGDFNTVLCSSERSPASFSSKEENFQDFIILRNLLINPSLVANLQVETHLVIMDWIGLC